MYATNFLVDARLKALADPNRRKILKQIWLQERSAGDIAGDFTISRPAISRHLRVLRESGLATTRVEGTARYYRANQKALAALRAHLDVFWEQR